MPDFVQFLIWTAVLMAGLGFCVEIRKLGASVDIARDLLHIGVVFWVFGLNFWNSPGFPMLMVWGAFALVVLLPLVAVRFAIAEAVVKSISGSGEGWSGIVLYVLSYAVFSTIAVLNPRLLFAAGGGLVALSLGDGLGGMIGREFGKWVYRLPWSKPKTFEGSIAVALATFAGLVMFAAWLSRPISAMFVVAAILAAIAEAVSPRATDNLTVPAIVFLGLMLV